jgi:poly-gamma-glutamate capsule biosynthesis protein CapA/YwtB (metallophosphatase superfamily)
VARRLRYHPGMAPLIGLLGDVMLGRGVAEALRSMAPEDVWDPGLRELLGECDVVMCNLECCISERGRPTERVRGKPFFFRAPPGAVRSLHAIGVRAAGLANNHALDYEEEALADTLTHLGDAGIATAGAGPGDEAARRPAIIAAAESRVGIVAVSDHPAEFAAGPDAWGIAHAGLERGAPGWLLTELAGLRSRCDHVIAFPHWGPNMTTRPARWQREVAAQLADAGADLVAGHSAHLFHGVGRHAGTPLLYDLGGALDDYAIDAHLRNDLGLAALWRPGGDPELELVGLRLDYSHTRLADDADAAWIAARLARACEGLGTEVERACEGRFRITPATA